MDPTCTGINFRLNQGQGYNGENGKCVTVAPDPNGESLRAVGVANINMPGWEYYGLTRK